METLKSYQIQFIDFLIESRALRFGEFTLKSGRLAPYFINTGNFDTGAKISKLGGYYAAHIVESVKSEYDVIFGPAYKGVPLAVATASALQTQFSIDKGFSFDRKELKDHGDRGKIVGHEIKRGTRIVLVEDVITAGTTLKEMVPLLHTQLEAQIVAVVIAVDRMEKGASALSAKQETERDLGLHILPIVTIHQILIHLDSGKAPLQLDAGMRKKINAYLEEYGAQAS